MIYMSNVCIYKLQRPVTLANAIADKAVARGVTVDTPEKAPSLGHRNGRCVLASRCVRIIHSSSRSTRLDACRSVVLPGARFLVAIAVTDFVRALPVTSARARVHIGDIASYTFVRSLVDPPKSLRWSNISACAFLSRRRPCVRAFFRRWPWKLTTLAATNDAVFNRLPPSPPPREFYFADNFRRLFFFFFAFSKSWWK